MKDENQVQVDVGAEYVAFRISDEEYCIEIRVVREIRRWTTATKLPHAPSYLIGVVNLRGAVVPVVDFAARLGGAPTEPTSRHTIIIVESDDQTIGLLVEAVSDILAAGTEDVQPTPQIAPPVVHDIISGIIVIDERVLRKIRFENIIVDSAVSASSQSTK